MSVSSKTAKASSKLVVRNKVLAAIKRLTQPGALSVFEKQKLIDDIQALNQPETAQDILLQELARAEADETLQDVIAELLIWLGDLNYLQEPVWDWIASTDTSDRLKDTLNLILKQLGDPTPTETYLSYLNDPDSLIDKETQRMLEMAADSPQARVDLLDFLLSLDSYNQKELLQSLIKDFDNKLLCQLFSPILAWQPNQQLSQQIANLLSESQDPQHAKIIADLYDWPEAYRPDSLNNRFLESCLKKLQLKGWYSHEKGWLGHATKSNVSQNHSLSLLKESQADTCYITLPDGMGNQAILMSRIFENEDKLVCCFVINDLIGIKDCFGFEQLALPDYNKVENRFLKNSFKTPITPEEAVYEIQKAQQKSLSQFGRLPYEFLCWQEAFSDVQPKPITSLPPNKAEKNSFQGSSHLLFEHPDIKRTWFLDKGDSPELSDFETAFSQWFNSTLLMADNPNFVVLDELIQKTTQSIQGTALQTQWGYRLRHTEQLLERQNQHTLAKLAQKALVEMQQIPSQSPFLTKLLQNSLLQWLLKAQPQTPTVAKDQVLALQSLVLKLKQYWTI